jgi:hypothetical protein
VPVPTEPSPFDDDRRRHLSLAPEDHSDFGRSSSACQNHAATLRSIEGLDILEEQAAHSETGGSPLGEELGRSIGSRSQIALAPKPLKSQRNAARGAEAKGLDPQESTLKGADTDHQDVSNFSFPFNHPKGIGARITEEVRRNRTLLPSILPRPGYSSPPNTIELPESEAQDYKFSVPTLKEFRSRTLRGPVAEQSSHQRHPSEVRKTSIHRILVRSPPSRTSPPAASVGTNSNLVAFGNQRATKLFSTTAQGHCSTCSKSSKSSEP